jgi:hypothetical protein
MKTVPWQNFKKPLQGGTLRNLNFKILNSMTSNWPKWGREPKFQLSRSYGPGCRRGTNFCQRRRRRRQRVTDGKIFIAFFTFYDFLSVKNMIWAKKNSKFLVWNQYFQYIPYMMKVKNLMVGLRANFKLCMKRPSRFSNF